MGDSRLDWVLPASILRGKRLKTSDAFDQIIATQQSIIAMLAAMERRLDDLAALIRQHKALAALDHNI